MQILVDYIDYVRVRSSVSLLANSLKPNMEMQEGGLVFTRKRGSEMRSYIVAQENGT